MSPRATTWRTISLVLVLLVLAACSASPGPERAGAGASTPPTTAPPPTRGGKVVVGTTAEVDGLNPLSSQWSGPGYQIGRSILDPLVVMDRDNHWRPYL